VTAAISVTTPSGTGTSATAFKVTPLLTGFTPPSAAEGAAVTIQGANLADATAVEFNGAAAAIVSATSTQVVATVPSTATRGKIAVTTPGGTATSAADFVVLPKIDSIAPTHGPVGTSVTIGGSGFEGTPLVVSFGGIATAVPPVVTSSTSLTAIVPPGAATAPITVVTPAGTSGPSGDFTVDAPATVRLNEVAPNINGSADLVELAVVTGGPLGGITLVQNPAAGGTTLATLPAITAAPGDLVVVHLNPAVGVATETGGTSDCSDATCYTGAWDVRGGATGVSFSNTVLVVRSAVGVVEDGVAFARTDPTSSSFVSELQALQGGGEWTPATCTGSPCTDTSTPTANAVSADWSTVGTTATGSSIRRTGSGTSASAWSVGAASFGLPNS
jgi:hypothetical protein